MYLLKAALLLAIAVCAGCTSAPYRPGTRDDYYLSRRLPQVQGEQIERGQPRPVLDTVGWIVGIPSKILLWNSKVDNHNISPETEIAIAQYLADNDLSQVKVRLNQYAPLDEWRRLTRNDSVGVPWRYTLGTLAVAGDAIFPGRLWGGSHYNPFTNSIHLYSDLPAEALHEAGHAKDFARRKYKGTYAAAYALLPGAPLWHEAVATNDALSYLAERGTYEEQRQAYELLYPAYGTYLGGTIGDWIGPPGLVYASGVVGGHVVGRIRSHRLPRPGTTGVQEPLWQDSVVGPTESDRRQTPPQNAAVDPLLDSPL